MSRVYELIGLADGVGREEVADALDRLIASQPALRASATSRGWRGLENLLDPAGIDDLVRNDTAGEPLRAFWLSPPSPGEPQLVLGLDAAFADRHAFALMRRLIEAALRGRPMPGVNATPITPRPGAPGGGPSSWAAGARLHEDGEGPLRRHTDHVVIELPAELWRRMEDLARDFGVTPFWIGWTAFALVTERLAEAPVALWRPVRRARSPADLLLIGPATPRIRFAPKALAEGGFIVAARSEAGRGVAASEAPLGPTDDEPVYGFELDDADRRLAEHHPGLGLGDLVVSARPWGHGPPDADLWLTLSPPVGARPAAASLAVDPARFSAARAKGFLEGWRCVLEAALVDPHAGLEDLPLASAYHRASSLPEMPDRAPCALDDAPADLAALFDRIVARWPGHRALVWPGGELTFAALSQAADLIGRDVEARGGRRGDRIAFRLVDEPTTDGLVLFLAVKVAALRLGCALVPLGLQLQADQARAQVARVAARFLFATGPTPDCLPPVAAEARGEPVPGFADASLFSLPGGFDAAAGARPGDDTAIIFTSSGTTGVPKSLHVGQSMLLGLLWGVARSGVLPSTPFLMGGNIGFDVFIIDVWMPWIAGSHVVLLPTERRTPAVIAQARALGARAMSLSPTVAAAALDDDPSCLAGLHTLHLMGEVFPPALLANLCEHAPDLALVNGYGPSENAVLATAWPARRGVYASLPIGRVLPGYRLLIGDAQARPLPAHWPGELLIASAAPALGYLDRDLTVERFIELPGEAPGPFFRSGDHGWVDETGTVQFIGRRDRQVKIAGVRIELDGIEHRIAEVEGVAQVGVVVAGAQGAERLVAFVQPHPDQPADDAFRTRIIEQCQRGLLRAAVPSAVMFLTKIPTGPTGKKSHSALRAMLTQPSQAAVVTPPRPGGPPNPIVDRLTRLWAEVLARRGVGLSDLTVHQDVVALGASSLDMMRVAERVERAFDIQIVDAKFLLTPTIAAQAELVAALLHRGGEAQGVQPAARRAGRHLIRLASPNAPTRGAVIGMPALHGTTAYIGHVTAQGLAPYEVWAFGYDGSGQDLIENDDWFDCARSIVAQILEDGPERPAAFIGFSFGGFLAWVVDRMLVAAGRPATPIVNLDGEALHFRRPDWRRRMQPFIPDAAAPLDPSRRARMLLIKVGASPRPLNDETLDLEWSAEDVDLSVCDVPTLNHLDFGRPWPVSVCAGPIDAFLDGQDLRSAPSPPITASAPLGARLFQRLAAQNAPSVGEVRELMEALPRVDADPDLELAVAYLALVAGEFRFVVDLATRVLVRSPTFRWAAYARVCGGVALGDRPAAEETARLWMSVNGPDTAMIARATGDPPPPEPWETMIDLRIDSDRALDLATAFGLSRG